MAFAGSLTDGIRAHDTQVFDVDDSQQILDTIHAQAETRLDTNLQTLIDQGMRPRDAAEAVREASRAGDSPTVDLSANLRRGLLAPERVRARAAQIAGQAAVDKWMPGT